MNDQSTQTGELVQIVNRCIEVGANCHQTIQNIEDLEQQIVSYPKSKPENKEVVDEPKTLRDKMVYVNVMLDALQARLNEHRSFLKSNLV